MSDSTFESDSSSAYQQLLEEDTTNYTVISVEVTSHEDKGKQNWRQVPRTPNDFYEEKSPISSCGDTDYDNWLENYYHELYREKTTKSFEDKCFQTLIKQDEKPDNVLTSLFQPVEKDFWSYNTKYWGPKDMRRHWPLRLRRNTYMFFPSIHPHLNLRSRYGRFHSLLNSAAAIPEVAHQKQSCSIFRKIVFGIDLLSPQLQKLTISDTLCNFKWFDYMTKEATLRMLCKILRKQKHVEKVYFENLGLDRKGGIILLCALSRNCGNVIKELHMWKMFGHGECPVLMNDLLRKEYSLPSKISLEYFTKIHYVQILNKFSNLTHLSVNYAYLANKAGDILLHLKSIRFGRLQKLNILCTVHERPLLTNPGYGIGGYKIPDGIWQRVAQLCPQLRVSFVFLNLPQYENVILFLSKYAPVSYVYLSSGIDLSFKTTWDIDSTLLELRNWYASTLETLSLHLWHHRDLLDFVIKRKILEEFPNLLNFEFIGVLEDVETLEEFCCQLCKGIYNLKTLLFWIEEKRTNEKELILTKNRVNEIRSKYRKKFLILNIDADLQTYAL